MTNDLYTLHKADWINIFILIEKFNATESSKPTFYERFMNSGLTYSYFSSELKQKLSDFHEKHKDKNYKIICEQWSHTFDKDFNLKDHFNIFLLSDNYYHQKALVKFTEEKIGKKDTFYAINRFFLDDNNASKFYILRKKWRELLEKDNFPINSNIVKSVVQDCTYNAVSKYSSTAELLLNFKMLVLGHLYNPDIKVLEEYIVKYSKDALFERRAFDYLFKKNIDLKLPDNKDNFSFIKREEFIYSLQLEPEYLLKKHLLTRKDSENICKGFVNYIHAKFNQKISDSFSIVVKSSTQIDYNKTKEIIIEDIAKLDKSINFIKERNLNSIEITEFLTTNIDKVAMKETLDTNLGVKPSQKKQKI